MINLEEIQKLVECAVLTGFVKNKDKGVNLLLIADAESGKSEIIQLLKEMPQVHYTSDLSTKPLIDELMPKFEREEISHLLIPDFITPLSHKKSAETLISILNNLLAEGLKDVKFYGVSRVFSKVVVGHLITGVTKEIFERKIINFRDNGFLSRVLPVTYSYSATTKIKIHNFIESGKYLEPLILKSNFSEFKLNSFNVEIPKSIAEKINLISQHLTDKNKSYSLPRFDDNGNFKSWNVNLSKYGFRLHKQLRVLVQGIALYNQKNPNPNKNVKVTEKDFEELQELTKYLNFEFTKI